MNYRKLQNSQVRLVLIWLISLVSINAFAIKSGSKQDTEKKKYTHLIMYGQSLSVGHQAYPVISIENIAGNYMIGNQIWINYDNDKSPVFNPLKGTIAVAFQKQKNIMNRSAGTIAECPLLGTVNHLQLKQPGQLFLATSSGNSGKTIEQLSPESQTMNLYDEFRATIKMGSEIAHESNSTIYCPAVFWMQGEWNYLGFQDGFTAGSKPTADKNEYKSLLIKLKNNMQNDIQKHYDQTEKPLFITYQVGAQYVKGREQSIGMAQLEAANENEDVVMAGPIYPMPDRGGHLDPNGYRWYGEMLAKVYYQSKVLEKKFKPLQPEKISRKMSANEIQIKFHVPHGPLVLDTLTTEFVNDYGFEVFVNDKETEIEKVTVSGDKVILKMHDSLEGEVEVAYAGKKTAGHGNLRDSDPYQSFFQYIDLDQQNPDGSFVFPRDSTETTLRPKYEPRDRTGKVIYNQHYPLCNFGVSFYYKLQHDEKSLFVSGAK
ncbi:hypothetical protein ACUNWD_06610 [Sunxiuqinia sp. A32]|uniref:hypothetical protein n=1 Tax=Sunxiuqinia sp. A32 TaxID=3461496 RepID=UPI004045851A